MSLSHQYVHHLDAVHTRHNHILLAVILIVVVAASVALLVVSNNQAAEGVSVNVIQPTPAPVLPDVTPPVAPAAPPPPAPPADSGKPWYRVTSIVLVAVIGAVGLIIAGLIAYNKAKAMWFKSKRGDGDVADATKEFAWTEHVAVSLRMVRPFLGVAFLCGIGWTLNSMGVPLVGDMIISLAGMLLFLRLLVVIIKTTANSIKKTVEEVLPGNPLEGVGDAITNVGKRVKEQVVGALVGAGRDRGAVEALTEKWGEVMAGVSAGVEVVRQRAAEGAEDVRGWFGGEDEVAGLDEAAAHLSEMVQTNAEGAREELQRMSARGGDLGKRADQVLEAIKDHWGVFVENGARIITTAFHPFLLLDDDTDVKSDKSNESDDEDERE